MVAVVVITVVDIAADVPGVVVAAVAVVAVVVAAVDTAVPLAAIAIAANVVDVDVIDDVSVLIVDVGSASAVVPSFSSIGFRLLVLDYSFPYFPQQDQPLLYQNILLAQQLSYILQQHC